VPSAQLDKLTALLARLSPAPLAYSVAMTPVASRNASGETPFAAGAVQLKDVALPQALELYQIMTRRTVQTAANVPSIRVTLRNQTPLTRGELIYAFDMVLGLHNLALVPERENNFKLVPSAELDRKLNSK